MNSTFSHIRAHRGTLRTATIVAALTSLILTMVTPFVGTAHAAGENPYTIDGVRGTEPLYNEICDRLDGNKAVDEILNQGNDASNLNDLHEWVGSVAEDTPPDPPGKSDICDVRFTTQIVDGVVWMYFGWDRDAETGSQVIYLELHENPSACLPSTSQAEDCNPFSGRAADDVILAFDFQGGMVNLGVRTFDGSEFGPVVAADPGIYDSAVSGDNFFGEAAVNLTGFGIFPAPGSDDFECITYGGALPYSITGNADSPDLKDIVLADLPPLSNCGSLTVVKQVTGGNFYGDSFVGSVTTLGDTPALTQGAPSHTFSDVEPGTYTVSEDDLPNGWSLDSIVCDDPDGGSAATIAAGDSVTCTITNTPDLPDLTVVKEVTNDDGGTMGASDFPVKVNGTSATLVADSPADESATDSSTWADTAPGTYTVTETAPDGYTLESIVCTGDGEIDGASVTLGLGDAATCTVTNNDDPGEIVIIKHNTSDNGGTLEADDFEIEVGSTDVVWGSTTPDGGDGVTTATGNSIEVEANTPHAITEVVPGGYALLGIECDDDTSGDNGHEVTVANGESVTCTVYNDDLEPGLTVIKKVDASYTDTPALPEDFQIEVYSGESAAGDPISTGQGAIENIDQAGTYFIREVIPAELQGQYEQSSISCLLGEQTVGQQKDGGIVVTVGLGEKVACTIVNVDIPGEITLVKQVINDNGGSAEADEFGVYAGDNEPTLDVADVADDGYDSTGSATLENLDAGTYTIGEDGLTGYTQTDISCQGGETEPGQVDGTLDLFLGLGDEVTCTIVNDDDPISLTVIKQVINDHNGPAEADEFGVFVDNDTIDLDVALVADDGYDSTGSATLNDLTVGTYTVGELGLDGYTQESIGCDVDTDPGDKAGTVDVALGLGDHVTCTIVNNDDPVGLTVIKQVENNWGGELTDASFPLYVDEELVTTGVETFVGAGTYDISEVQQDGYEHVSSTCVRDGEGFDVEGKESFSVTVANGESVVCTFVNRDVPASLTVLKEVINDDGGDAVVTDFTAVVNAENTDWGSQDVTIGDQTGVAVGDYTVGEIELEGYEMASISCSDETVLGDGDDSVTVSLGHGDDVTCTIVNDDIAPTVVLRKTVVNDDGGTLTQDDFPVSLDGDTVAWDDVITIQAGDHTAAETTQDGYAASQWGGDCTGNGSFTAEPGGTYECTITNDDVPAGLTVVKQVINDDGGTANVANFDLGITPLDGSRQSVLSGQESVVAAGTYTIDEVQIDGYEMTSISCTDGTRLGDGDDSVTVTVGNDESVVCTIVNDDLPIGIQVVKVADQDTVVFDPDGDPVVVTYTYTVTNTGSTELTDVTLLDDILGEITLPGDTLPIGGIMIGTATHTVTQADADAGTIVNVATVEGTSPDGRKATDDDDEVVDVTEVAGVQIEADPLPATGYDTQRLALLSALAAALGLMLLMLTRESAQVVRRDED